MKNFNGETLPARIKRESTKKELPLTVTTHNIVHVFWRELMVRVNGCTFGLNLVYSEWPKHHRNHA